MKNTNASHRAPRIARFAAAVAALVVGGGASTAVAPAAEAAVTFPATFIGTTATTGLTLAVIAPDVTGDAAADTTAAVAELQAFAELHGAASIRVLPADATGPTVATAATDSDALLQDALAEAPDVIVVLGETTLTALDSATASRPDLPPSPQKKQVWFSRFDNVAP